MSRSATPAEAAREQEESRADAKLDVTISRVLVVGLAVAIGLLLVGVILTVARPELPPLHSTSIVDIPRSVVALEPGGFFELGLLLLLATPAARVVALCVGFGRRGKWLFTGLGLFVLLALALSVFLGLRGG